jgi:hypothetical protein
MRIRIRIQLITLMWVRIQIQLITVMRLLIRILPFNLMWFHADPDPDPQT